MSLGDFISAIYVKMNKKVIESVRLSVGGVGLPSLKLIKAVEKLNGRCVFLVAEEKMNFQRMKVTVARQGGGGGGGGGGGVCRFCVGGLLLAGNKSFL